MGAEWENRQPAQAEENAEKITFESLGILAAGLAHEFNNLLTVVLGHIGLAKLTLDQQAPAARNLSKAEAASLQTRDLVQRLLFFAGSQNPVRSSTSIAGLIQEATATALANSSIESSMAIDEDLWLVAVDVVQMKQVFYHLTSLAAKATPYGSSIEVSATNITLTEDREVPAGRYVRVAIRGGHAFSEMHCRKIFTPYFTTKTLSCEREMSLGLAIAETVIRSHQGILTVEAEPHSGLAYIIHLPAMLAVPHHCRTDYTERETVR